jgi:hypothetical protein
MILSLIYLLGIIVGFVGGLGCGIAYRDYQKLAAKRKARGLAEKTNK